MPGSDYPGFFIFTFSLLFAYYITCPYICANTNAKHILRMELKYRIKEILQVQGRRQDWVAAQLGVDRSQISVWANLPKGHRREIRYSTMVKIANILGCTVEDLHTENTSA